MLQELFRKKVEEDHKNVLHHMMLEIPLKSAKYIVI